MKIDHYISQCEKYVLIELNDFYIFILFTHQTASNIYLFLTADTNKVSFKCKNKTWPSLQC